MSKRISFHDLPWEEVSQGFLQKTLTSGNSKMRLIKVNSKFTEDDWCRSSHSGYVLEGECIIDFEGKREDYKKGDCIFIQKGEPHKLEVTEEHEVLILLLD